MGHVPHLYIPRPWGDGALTVDDPTRHHLERVLRRGDGTGVTYTDGEGTTGAGEYRSGTVHRGEESPTPPPVATVTIAMAPPRVTDRARFAVEKLAELGVSELVWLDTRHGEGRPPKVEKAAAWAVAALEQSRGSRLPAISGPRPTTGPWPGSLYVADPAGAPAFAAIRSADAPVILIGPEGGWAEGEVPEEATPISLGERTLRVETAAVVAAALALARG